MKIYVINLDRAPERLAYIDKTLTSMGLFYTRVSAVDGQLLSEKRRHEMQKPSEKFYYLGPGELGCFLSHRECWKSLAQSTDDYACILEDDVHLSNASAEVLGSETWIPEYTDIVKIETNFAKTLIENNGIGISNTRQITRLLNKHTSSGGYIISRSCAKKLYEMTELVTAPLDQFVFNPVCNLFYELVIYQLNPAICVQDSVLNDRTECYVFKSELDVERTDLLGDAKPTWYTIAGFIRKVHKHRTLMGMRLRSLSPTMKLLRVPFE